MVDTTRSRSTVLTLLADNGVGAISAQDVRDAIVSMWPEDCFDVRNYGATGDGTTDDADAILAALSAASSAGGGRVYVPASSTSYKVTKKITIPANVFFYGDGINSTIETSGNHRVIEVLTDNVTVCNLHIKGDADGDKTTQYGIMLSGADNARVIFNFVENMGYDGILPTTNCVGTLIMGNYVWGCQDDGINPGSIVDSGVTHTRIIGNYVWDCLHTGIHISDGSRHTVVEGNIVEDCRDGIDFYRSSEASVHNNVITNCDRYGVAIALASSDFSIEGNRIYGGTKGIYIQQASTNFDIKSNKIYNPSEHGILISQTGDVLNGYGDIEGNRIRGACANNGIVITNFTGLRVHRNRIHSITGDYSIQETGTSTGNTFTDNVAEASTDLLSS